MLDHHIQKHILFRLAFEDALSFSQLKPDDLDNKLFTYHLKKVVSAGFVEKREDGHYQLTPTGRRMGKGALTKERRFIDRAYSLLILVIRTADGKWLLYRRSSQPLRGYNGFVQARPVSGEPVVSTAKRTLEAIGLRATISVAGQAFLTMNRNGEMESYIHATVLLCNDAQGTPINDDTLTLYDELPIGHPLLIPSVPLLAAIALGERSFDEGVFEL